MISDKSLKDAYQQLALYREDLDNPPLLVVCDLNRFEVHTNFTGTAKRVYAFSLSDLTSTTATAMCAMPPLEVLRRLFKTPNTLRPEQTAAQVTELAAAQFALVAQRLQSRGVSAEATAHFLMRLLFCFFAEDVGLLPEKLFKRLVERTRTRPADFGERLSQLFGAMATGGAFGVEDIPYFNGGLFTDSTVLPLTTEDMDALLHACTLDWSSVEPAIFGTMFERSLDPSKRAQLGAHYTSREDIELIVEPVLVAPWRQRWATTQKEAEVLIARGAGRTTTRRGGFTEETRRLRSLLMGFAGEIAAIRVLDPACGSGNFLYVSLKHLLDLEKEVITFAASNGLPAFFPQVGPQQLHGIEINEYAYELAQVVVWIGYLQWLHDNGFGVPPAPILKPLHTVQHMDAVLTMGADGVIGEPNWPDVDVIVGNPPFLGGKKLRTELGDTYVARLFRLWDTRVPREADLCCYWFEKAREHIERGRAKRAGLLATQAIRAGKSRVILEHIKRTGDIFYAQADRPWVLDGADVRISMVGFDDGSETHKSLNAQTHGTAAQARTEALPVETIYADLSASIDMTRARRLKENLGLSFMGDTKVGSFEIDAATAQRFLAAPNPDGRSNADVVRPWVNGDDVAGRPRNMWIIDFPPGINEAEAALYEGPFEYVRDVVRPTRLGNKRAVYATRWWVHGEARPGMRLALRSLTRYLATPGVAKHRVFKWFSTGTLPDHRLTVVAREDDFTFGVLQSRVHELWALATSSRHGVGNDPVYNNTTCFETFPFPDTTAELTQTISDAAGTLCRLREGWLNPPFATGPELGSRTLTNLYNQRPTWLMNAHMQLDAAVFEAYGWPSSVSDEDILAQLLELNRLRAPL